MIRLRELLLVTGCIAVLAAPGLALTGESTLPKRAPDAASRPAATRVPIPLAVLSGSADLAANESDVLLNILAEAIEGIKALKVLDRDNIQKLLGEHRLSAAGVVRQPVKHGPMLGARYLLYVGQEQNATARTLAILCIEVSSGNVIWDRAFSATALTEPKAIDSWAAEVARDTLTAMTANEILRGRPTATVLAVANRSRSARMDFLENSLQGLLENLLESRGYRVLRRRNPGLLAKETTLGISGMMRPDAAVLAEAADLVVTASFVESPSGDVAFEQTPIKLALGLKQRTGPSRNTAFTFALAELKMLPGKLRSAMPTTKAASGATIAPAKEPAWKGLEAARLMAELKNLPYIAPLKDHRRQIELAQRVLYLDPSAKEAYYRLGISLDALTRRTWYRGGSQEGSSQDTADALSTYLRFPRTNPKHVRWAFAYLAVHGSVLHKGSPEKNLPLLAEYVRWRHEQGPVKPPQWTCHPSHYFDDWWAAHPQERVYFYTWMDRLYKKKKHLSVVPFKLAAAYDQLKRYDQAARYLYDGLVSHRLSRLKLNGVTGGEVSGWWQSGRPRELAKCLDAKRSTELLARLNGAKKKRVVGLAGMYGATYGNAEDLYDYIYRADENRLGGLKCKVMQAEETPLGRKLVQSVIVRKTGSGLWMQGGATDGTLVLFFSKDGRSWRAIKTPQQMRSIRSSGNRAEATNRVISIVQLGDEVLFATKNVGLFVYDRHKDAWRHYGTQEGLAAKTICQMTVSADEKSAWIAGGGFLCRYRDGKLFLPKAKITLFPDGMVTRDDHLVVINNEEVLAVQPEGGKKKTLLTRSQQWRLRPAPARFYGPPRGYNAGVDTFQRLLVVEGKVYVVSKHGLVVLGADGKPAALWRPDTFYRWNELGGWVLGNCPLPPCLLSEAIRDDQNPNLLWLVSKANDKITPYTFAYGVYPKELWSHILGIGSDTMCFITAFDTKRGLFSKPLRTKAPFTHAGPCGDYIYLTGRTFGRLGKKLWVVDQPGAKNDQPPKTECPDTLVGRASRALLLGNRKEARACLQSALNAGIAPADVKRILNALAKQSQPES